MTDGNRKRDYEGENGIIKQCQKSGKEMGQATLVGALLTIGIDGNLNSHKRAV